MEGNPWRWEADEWIQCDDYDISTDFPPIREWEKKMSGVENRLCIRHINRRESVENEKNKNDSINIEELKKENNNDNCESNHNSRYNLVRSSGKSTTSVILTQFPNTAHNILIIEKIRQTKTTLDGMLVESDQILKKSNTYKNNKILLDLY